MYKEGRLATYLTDAASGHATPGGGSVSALVGALATTMSEMCANFTVKSRKYASVRGTVKEMLDELEQIRASLVDLMERDVKAYNAVNTALGMPRETESQRAARKQALDGAFRTAIEPPLKVTQKVSRLSSIAGKLVDIGNPNLMTDVAVSAILAEAACSAARLNVEVNVRYLGDKSLAKKLNRELDSHCRTTAGAREKVVRKVNKHLKRKRK